MGSPRPGAQVEGTQESSERVFQARGAVVVEQDRVRPKGVTGMALARPWMVSHRRIAPGLALIASAGLGIAACSVAQNPFAGPGGHISAPARANPLNPEEPLHCAPIWNLTAAEATSVLQGDGWHVSYVWVVSTGPDSGFGQPLASPPSGVVTNLEYGDPGWLEMFVSPVGDRQAVPVPRPKDCP